MRDDEPTLTVNGKPIEDYLQQKTDERRVEEAAQIYTAQIWDWKKCIPRPKFKYPTIRPKSGKAKIWTKSQIRKEYGMEAKPVQIISILQFIKGSGPVTIREIAEKLNASPASIGTTIRKLVGRIPGIVEKVGNDKPFHYRITHDAVPMVTDEMYKEYLASGKIDAPKRTPKSKPVEIPKPGPAVNIPQEIKVTVEVSGEINFLFGFKK